MDLVIYHRVAMILAEMGLHGPISLIEDFDPDFSIKNCGPHRPPGPPSQRATYPGPRQGGRKKYI